MTEPRVKAILLSVQDVARWLQVSQRTVWRWVQRGVLPAPLRLPARRVRWNADDLKRHLANLETPRNQPAEQKENPNPQQAATGGARPSSGPAATA